MRPNYYNISYYVCFVLFFGIQAKYSVILHHIHLLVYYSPCVGQKPSFFIKKVFINEKESLNEKFVDTIVTI